MSKGAWWLQLDNIESHIKDSLAEESFGLSVDTFYFGFELTDVAEGLNFEATKGYMSYRPSASHSSLSANWTGMTSNI